MGMTDLNKCVHCNLNIQDDNFQALWPCTPVTKFWKEHTAELYVYCPSAPLLSLAIAQKLENIKIKFPLHSDYRY